MSESTAVAATGATRSSAGNGGASRPGGRSLIKLLLVAALLVVLLALPIYVPEFWLRTGFAVFAAIVGAMAASAWISRFPRYRVGIGAVLFVISDLLIFAREGGHVPEAVTWWTIWPLYYAGQFLIATGVVRTLRAGRA